MDPSETTTILPKGAIAWTPAPTSRPIKPQKPSKPTPVLVPRAAPLPKEELMQRHRDNHRARYYCKPGQREADIARASASYYRRKIEKANAMLFKSIVEHGVELCSSAYPHQRWAAIGGVGGPPWVGGRALNSQALMEPSSGAQVAQPPSPLAECELVR
jgi:hypothetical protein